MKLTFAGCLACFLLGLPCVSYNGQYVFSFFFLFVFFLCLVQTSHLSDLQRYVLNLMDTYGAGFAVIWIALWEVIALMWIYGVCNFSKVSNTNYLIIAFLV